MANLICSLFMVIVSKCLSHTCHNKCYVGESGFMVRSCEHIPVWKQQTSCQRLGRVFAAQVVVCRLFFVYSLLFESTIYSSTSVQYIDGRVTVFRNSSSSLRPGGTRLVSDIFSQVALGATRELPLCLGAAAMSASRFDAKSAHNRRPCNGHCNPSMACLAAAA